jgi:hypothetical protein
LSPRVPVLLGDQAEITKAPENSLRDTLFRC